MRSIEIALPDGRRLDIGHGGAERGPLVLLHHGTPGSRVADDAWEAAAAARGARIAMASRAGYGASSRQPGRAVADAAADAAHVLAALGAERCVVVGHSGGGPHALACAALLGERVTGCVSVAGIAPFAREGLDFLAGMGEDNVLEFGRAIEGEAALRPLLEEWAADLLAAGPERFAELLRSLMSDVDLAAYDDGVALAFHAQLVEGLAGGVDGWLDDDLAFVQPWGFDLAGIAAPVHVWQGEHDLMVPPAHGDWLAGAIPGCVHVRRADHGHISLMAGGFVEVLDDALALA